MSNCPECTDDVVTPTDCPTDETPCQTDQEDSTPEYNDLEPGDESPCHDPLSIEDGVYTSVTVKDGCIIGFGQVEPPVYTPPLCCPSCGDTIIGEGTPVSTEPCNLTKVIGGELLTKVYFSNSGNVTHSGCGTTSSPFVLNAPASGISGICMQPGTPQALTITGSGTPTDCYIISHKTLPVIDTDWITTDGYGHVTDFAPQPADQIPVIPPLKYETVGGITQLTIEGYTVTVETLYHTLTYNSGVLISKVDKLGSITAGQFETVDGRTISYNTYGLIIANVATPP